MTSIPTPLRRLAACFALWPALASAQATEWTCWYTLDQHVSCLLLQAPLATELSAEEALQVRLANAPTPAGGTLPLVVSVMRERPHALRSLMMRIPLWGDPVDMLAVAELAQAVMCGSRPDCTARYSAQPAATPAGAAALADAWDPVLQLRL
jgi:hypothetical protein